MSKTNKHKKAKNPKGGQTLGMVWGKLDLGDRALILHVVRLHGKLNYDVHMGLLPFVPVAVAVQAISTARKEGIGGPSNMRVLTRLLQKLKGTSVDLSAHGKVQLVLRHARVVKRFGEWLKKGLRIPFAQAYQTTAGLKWSLPHRAYIDDNEAKVFPMFTLTFVRQVDKDYSVYILTCPKKYTDQMRHWLNQYCR